MMNSSHISSSRLLTPLAYACLQALSGLAVAQTIPGIGDALKQTQPIAPQPPSKQTEAPTIVEQPLRPLSLSQGQTLLVKIFQIKGAEGLVAESDIQAVLAPYQGQALNMAQINEATSKVTTLLRSRGYLLANTYVPRQDANQGTLILQVVPGQLDKTTIHNQSLVRDAVITNHFETIQAQPAITQQALERQLLLIDDLPGTPMPKVTIAPGETSGTSDFALDVAPDKRVGGYVLTDNMGSRYTGKNRVSAALDVNSPLGLGDLFSLSALHSEGNNLNNGRAAYSLPLGTNGLRAELAASKTTYALGGDYADLDATGTAHTVETTFSYPLQRSRNDSWWISLNMATRYMKDEIQVVNQTTPKRANVATLALQRDTWSTLMGLPYHLGMNLGLSYGRLRIIDSIQDALNRAGANTTGQYARTNIALNNSIDLSPKWNWAINASAQKALQGKNLDSSEQMNISGPSAVKSYREVVSGDNGYLLGTELRYALPGGALNHALSVFADLGRVTLEKGDYANSNGSRLADVGVSYQIRYKLFYAKLQLARSIGPRPDEAHSEGKTRALLQGGMIF